MRLDLDAVVEHVPDGIDDQPHDAGVVIPVVDRPTGHHLVLTKRADDLRDHPGQMSFPGGGRESEDETIVATALREAHEEVGLRPEEATVVGVLDDIRTVTEYAVTPVVARVPDREYVPSEHEVAEVAVLPVAGLTAAANHEYERREHPYYGDVVIHYFHVDGYTVWGATGRIVVQLLELGTEWRAPEQVVDDGRY